MIFPSAARIMLRNKPGTVGQTPTRTSAAANSPMPKSMVAFRPRTSANEPRKGLATPNVERAVTASAMVASGTFRPRAMTGRKG